MRLIRLATASPLLIGVSEADDGNMALHTGDDPVCVNANRAKIAKNWHSPIHWMNQVHATDLAEVVAEPFVNTEQSIGPSTSAAHPPTVDGLFTHASPDKNEQRATLAVLTADCLPVILYSECGTQYAAVHAGWRGLVNGILSNAVKTFSTETLHAYIGPAISQPEYQVPLSFRTEFEKKWREDLSGYFQEDGSEHLRADLAGLAQHQLASLGVKIKQSQFCTALDPCFFSYRRHKTSKRLATVVGPPAN
ncbi:polyphenol oxidase family protein [uncultured Umboniibacter sp.]|uniref:polyphenol oxidase family protein n=1 Tax=uncultured Umboniibacter sp. TaxID=1798917 RepID=UPI002615F163|nr:polyphenol oxidase family protein [uncultured Umboniibacter sp.]